MGVYQPKIIGSIQASMLHEKPRILMVVVNDRSTGSEGNPGLTDAGAAEILSLRQFIPEAPTRIICGTGKRHLDAAAVLGLTITLYSTLAGRPEMQESDLFSVRLADGTRVPHRRLWDNILDAEAIKQLLQINPNDSIIITDRSFLLKLGVPPDEVIPAAVYYIWDGYITRYAIAGDEYPPMDASK